MGNRMLTAYWRKAGFLLEEGASPAQIDAAMQDFGMAMGLLAMAELAGLDINWATRKRLAPTRPEHLRYSRVADRICELGCFGQKTGAGYYRYETGSRTPLPDPVVDDIIKECAREAGIVRRPMRDTEIVDRCVLALVNEGAYILEDGIAQRASDIDLVYVNGYGFPAFRGGPMFHADTLGLPAVSDRIDVVPDRGRALEALGPPQAPRRGERALQRVDRNQYLPGWPASGWPVIVLPRTLGGGSVAIRPDGPKALPRHCGGVQPLRGCGEGLPLRRVSQPAAQEL
ncbi:3-hydroxyacyl-CoA dehydrogenase family protein [Roseomonas pecuniae]|uniref:3-hydroxyacyl-CoA dehydrogenase family protein n=1 Tax=Roseomonas populi TaxID=3121582 RepID=A0ABT1XC57_9PROT|nr:3-hydroxyacyl-CoA dehydrogenase family protein [Roseomonas pecuniae]MCR0984993.1 3-hydroxyacyl-CoA dehydrogenase family protein [Roseomonas pecuniae]